MLTHRAAWAMMEPGHWIASPAVTLEGNRIVSVAGGSRARTQGPVVDHGPGVILPILVNAHTHLSLSALRGRLPWDRGFVPWVQALMKERAALSEAQALGACGKAVEEMTRRGVGAVGEFGAHVAVEKALGPSPLAARVWLEFFGDARRLPPLPGDTRGISWAYAAHAPHTVSPGGLCRIREQDRRSGRPFCLHLAESREEVLFLEQGGGPWAEFLASLGLDFSAWGLPVGSPVAYAHRLRLLDSNTLAVHLTQAGEEDLDLLAGTGTRVCVCPRSNWNLHRRLPPLEEMVRRGLEPALGTDSLASVHTLDLFDEMGFVAEQFPGLSPDTILAMVTLWGARALHLPGRGTLIPGSRAGLIFVGLEARNPSEAALRLVYGEFDRVIRLEAPSIGKEETRGL